MKFKSRKIRDVDFKQNKNCGKFAKFLSSHKKKLVFLLLLFFSGLALTKYVFDTENLNKISEKIFDSSVLKASKNGRTNILILGVAGGGNEGGNLSDSIMILSMGGDNHYVSMLNLPRDLYISSQIGDRKINEIYAAARYKYGDKNGLNIVKKAISSFVGFPIHYAAVVNFAIFRDTVDLIGGIDIFVAEDIDDPYYPDVNYGFQSFVVRKGLQHFDGEMALKYARSRKTTSDYSRAHRQQDLLFAIKQRMESLGWVKNVEKIREFYNLFRKQVNTDLGLAQILLLAKTGSNFDFANMVTGVLNDDPSQKGGFLYTPAQEFYAGHFVLLPKDLRRTQQFMNLLLEHPEILMENAQIEVSNGTKIENQAGRLAVQLRNLGFHVIEISNYDSELPVQRSFLKMNADKKFPLTLQFLKSFVPTNIVQKIPVDVSDDLITKENLIDISVIIGEDW